MVCIYCGGKTQVTNSRSRQGGLQIWRRRTCKTCRAKFTSNEEVLKNQAISISSSGHYEPFWRDKLFISIYDSLRHRKSPIMDAAALTDTIISKSLTHAKSGKIEKSTLSTIAHECLKRFDNAAAVHYQAFYLS